jgi:hypothetical protein
MRVLPFIFTILFYTAAAQTDSVRFGEMKKVEINEYVIPLPAKWKKIFKTDEANKEQKFEITGVGLPETLSGEPFTASFAMRRFDCTSINAAEDFVQGELTSYPDKITPKGSNYERDTLFIASGQMATLFSTRFYRQTRHFNFSRFDLVVYSTKRKAAYLLKIIYQYKDPTYAAEKTYALKEYAVKIFGGLVLR